ncbi:putative nuclease of restriction endonuclease-like (RecB) superfamily [Pedobacter sp. UYP30]|uniref:PDDEXK nuclease domain-containing protein n=1 Tax=Pedobacter sp. UYP30 TaxID=1756400 RepID=UPI0033960DB3
MSELLNDNLFKSIKKVIEESRNSIVRYVNTTMVFTYFHIGKMIVEDEQNGLDRAVYSKETLKHLSHLLNKEYGKGYSVDNLEKFRKFYIVYSPEISESLIRKSAKDLFSLFQDTFKLSWTHYFHLLKIQDAQERKFYEMEANSCNWSIREMLRQYNSSLYERLALSNDKNGVSSSSKRNEIGVNPFDTLKSPYVLEFLGLREEHQYSENDLETAIINKLEQFMLELGKGFLFEARQKRITLEGDHYYVDLSFYNRLLKCFVLIDLKIGKLTHEDIGQMQMYVNYHDRKLKLPEENPTIGIILCKEENKAVVEFTLPEGNKQIFAKEYKLYLPSKDDLKKQLE